MSNRIVAAVASFLLVLPVLAAANPAGGSAPPAPAPVPSGSPGAGRDSCPPPRVEIFDLSIPPDPVPTGTELTKGSPQTTTYFHWLDLTTAYGGVSEALINKDPTRSGIEYLDLTIANAGSGHTVMNYKPGVDTAPAGALHGIDYLVAGQLTGVEGAYAVSVSLQDATTRAQVAAGHASFQSSEDSMTAAETAASQLTPALRKIRAYQQMLKRQNSGMAISPPLDQPQVTTAKHSLKSGESTLVWLSLRDCEGLPLAHRTLKLKATHGRISPASVVTDAAGRARATFTATSIGPAMIQADYGPFETVTHSHDQRRGSAAVAVQASGIWQLTLDANWHETGSTAWKSGINSEDDHSSKQASVHALELIRSATPDPLTNSNARGWNLISGNAQASASASETMLEAMHIPNGQSCRSARSFAGSSAKGLPGIAISQGDPVKLDLQFEVSGTQYWSYHCAPFDSNPGDSTTAQTFNYQLENTADWRGSCSRSGDFKRGYIISCTLSTTHADESVLSNSAPMLPTITGSLHLTMTPL